MSDALENLIKIGFLIPITIPHDVPPRHRNAYISGYMARKGGQDATACTYRNWRFRGTWWRGFFTCAIADGGYRKWPQG